MAIQMPHAAPASAAQVTAALGARYLAHLKTPTTAVPTHIADPSTHLCKDSAHYAFEAAGAPTAERTARTGN